MTNIQKKIISFAFLDQMLFGVMSVLSAFVVFKITDSVAIAALSSIAEGISSALFFISGGHLIAKYKSRNVHLTLELVKLFSLLLFALAVFKSWAFLIVIAQTLFAASWCLISIIFDNLTFAQWKKPESLSGFSKLSSVMVFGRIFSALIVFVIADEITSVIFLGAIHVGFIAFMFLKGKDVYIDNETKFNEYKYLTVKKAISVANNLNKDQLSLAFLSVSIWVPAIFFVSYLPFVIDVNFESLELNIETLTIAIMGILFLFLINSIFSIYLSEKTKENDSDIIKAIFFINISCFFVFYFSNNEIALIICSILIISADAVSVPWFKAKRQLLIKTKNFSERNAILGTATGFEYISFIICAVIAILSQSSLMYFGLLFLPLFLLTHAYLPIKDVYVSPLRVMIDKERVRVNVVKN